MARHKSHLQKDIASGKVELPKELSFLGKTKYFSVAEHQVLGVKRWYVEVPATWLSRLLPSKKKLNEVRAQLKGSIAEIQTHKLAVEELKKEVLDLQKKLDDLKAANRQLMQNIDEDQSPDKFQRSPKNYFNVADETGFKPRSIPLQGGLAGLEKK